jgi:single-strand DNA-binding protein
MSINKAIIVGNLGLEPTLRSMSNGVDVTSISVATSECWYDKETNQKNERTEWHKVSIFGPLAGIAADNLCKGSKVFIEGKFRTNKYQGKDGIDRWRSEIIANHIEFLDKKNEYNSIAIQEETLCNIENEGIPF